MITVIVPRVTDGIPTPPPPPATTSAHAQFAGDLSVVMARIEGMLVSKNRKYGDAALNPANTFARVDPIELINVRLDDKLSRIRNRQDDEDEDVEIDLIGYLIIKQIAKIRLHRSKNTLIHGRGGSMIKIN